MDIVDKLITTHSLTKAECIALFQLFDDENVMKKIREEAVRLQKKYYGTKVYARGLIEFTNYCKNNCYYCGIRRDNHHIKRYRLSEDDILSCCENGARLGFHTFVLQGGEDPWYTKDRMSHLIRRIKKEYPDCAITLSVGEKSQEEYLAWKEAGADRYLLRHETADESHYRSLHPESMSLSNRKKCLYELKEIGYQVGAGFMVGSPGQTWESLAEDLVFLQELKPQMVGIGPFIPHHDTVFADKKAGSVDLTLKLLSVIRILLPKVLLPATTALGTLDPLGREKGFCAGANVVMPNLSPVENRKQYELYDNKICTGDEAAQCKNCLSRRVKNAGYELVWERGDYPEEKITKGAK
ncbi:MAG: [FeFe] hydrogenase H-cluster radical SAM maturase HydE [Anaerobutyricum sp.]|nr:[FeFe] hydrogenase H-cluster radical SAM maturase HydE [Anaerobutyricum sp.]